MRIYVSEKVLDSVDFSDNEKIEMMRTVDLGILDTSEADVNYAGAYEIFAEREQAVWDKRNAGLTFKQIAEDLGLCVQTVSFAFGRAQRKIKYRQWQQQNNKPTEVDNLKHELEVYKRALEIANHNDLSWCNYCIIKARNELDKEVEYEKERFINTADNGSLREEKRDE